MPSYHCRRSSHGWLEMEDHCSPRSFAFTLERHFTSGVQISTFASLNGLVSQIVLVIWRPEMVTMMMMFIVCHGKASFMFLWYNVLHVIHLCLPIAQLLCEVGIASWLVGWQASDKYDCGLINSSNCQFTNRSMAFGFPSFVRYLGPLALSSQLMFLTNVAHHFNVLLSQSNSYL